MALTRTAARLGCALAALVLAGCSCVVPPPPEKYFSRADPVGTVNFFRYALETEQYASAYSCIPPVDREEFSQARFSIAARFYPHPQYDLRVREYLIDCVPVDLTWHPSGEGAVVETQFDREDLGIFTEEQIYLLLVDGVWYLDLKSTAEYWLQ